MPQLFKVRWPLLARLEAALLFPVALVLASGIEPVRGLVFRGLVPRLSPLGIALGIPNPVIFWAAMTLIVIVPYFCLLLLAARGLALLSHLGALLAGLRDRGEVAERLIVARNDDADGRLAQRIRDVYLRQTADFPDWRAQPRLENLGAGPRESHAIKMLHAFIWIGVVVGLGTAYVTWNGFAGLGHGMGRDGSGPDVQAGPVGAGPGAKRDATVLRPTVQVAPVRPPANVHVEAAAPPMPPADVHVEAAAPPLPPANEHVVRARPLPTVLGPTVLSDSVRSGSAISGFNEAVSERGRDGSFAFDAVVNGTHVRMLFDTGASVVGLRAEDAVRLGIPVTRLTYSAKIKTANGTADVAPVMIDTMMIGNITLRNVSGFVAKPGMLQENLLGQTFLARLSGFNVERNLLVLKGR